MQLIEIYVVGAEATQRRLEGAQNVLARVAHVPRLSARWEETLRGDDELLATRTKPLTDQFLSATGLAAGGTERIGVGRVEERDARIGSGVHDRERGLVVTLIAESHRAEAQAGDLQSRAPEANVFHLPTIQRTVWNERALLARKCGNPPGGLERGDVWARRLFRWTGISVRRQHRRHPDRPGDQPAVGCRRSPDHR